MKEFKRIGKSIIFLLTAAPFAGAQPTQLNLARESKNVDFSNASSTKPAATGPVIPATCSVGDVFFRTNAVPGQNLYGCTATNLWSQLGGGGSSSGGGAGMASQLGDFAYTASGTVATIGANCSASTPCVYRFGAISAAVKAPATATISGTAANDTAYVYLSINNTPAITVGYAGAETITCSACSAAPGITGFPSDGTAIPLYTIAIAGNAWAGSESESRAIYSKEFIEPDQGIVVSPNPVNGAVTVQIDSTVVPRYFTGSGAPSINCTQGRDFYTDTGVGNSQFGCSSTNTWSKLSETIPVTFTAGAGVTSVTCTSAFCDINGGSLSIAGGTATTGTIATVNYATLAVAPRTCLVAANGGSTFLGLGHGTPGASSFTITAAVSIAGQTVNLDYSCRP